MCDKREKLGKLFFVFKKQTKIMFFLVVFILLETLAWVVAAPAAAAPAAAAPAAASSVVASPVVAVSPCEAEFIERKQDVDEDRWLNLAAEAEQDMENAGEMLDKIKYVEENKSLFFEADIENGSSTSSSELQSLEEILSAGEFFFAAYNKFQWMANAFLNQATNAEHSELQNFEVEFYNLKNVFDRKRSYFQRQIQALLSGTVGFQNGISNSAGSQLLLENLVENPHLLQANTPYFVEFSNNQTSAFVIFDESVVDVFLEPRNGAFHFDLLRRSLSSIRKGFTSGSGSTGLKLLKRRDGHTYKDIFGVTTKGKFGGTHLGGFINNKGNLHIVHYKKDSEHTIGKWSNFADVIISKRDSI